MNIKEILNMADGSIQDYHLIVQIALFCLENRDESINRKLTKKIDSKFINTELYPVELKPVDSKETEGNEVEDICSFVSEELKEFFIKTRLNKKQR